MGSVGDSYDNALAETINGLSKASERVHMYLADATVGVSRLVVRQIGSQPVGPICTL